MNRLQEQSLQAKDSRYITDVLDDGFADNSANHEKTQEMLTELLNRSDKTVKMTAPPLLGGLPFDREFYNLFVIGGEKFESGSFTVSKERALVACIEQDVKIRFFNLRDDSVVERILSLPSLFMSENVDYMRSQPGQKALLGRVTDLEIGTNAIKISYEASARILQQRVTDISHSLGMLGNPGSSELNDTHWTIKQIDLVKVLTDTGLLAIPSV
jgi:hypothetical protein